MIKRKPRYEGPDYCDYQDLFDGITTELENLYHTLWDRRKESPKFRLMGKQAKTAWMLWKLGSTEYWRREGEGLHYTNQLEERRNNHIIYVRAIRLLHEAQTRIGQNDEKEAWAELFTHFWKRYAWWYD